MEEELSFKDGFTCIVSEKARGEVLLFHGLTSSPQEMEELSGVLYRSGFNVSVPRFSGHSGDLAQLKQTTAESWIDDTRESFNQLKKRSPHLPCFIVGVSFGSLLALFLAASRRDEVDGLVVLSPPILLKSKMKEILLTGISFFPNWLLNMLGVVKKSKRDPNTFSVPREAFPVHSIAAVARCIGIRRKLSRNLSKIICPVLILQDPEDHLVDKGAAALLQKQIAAARVHVELISGGEHELTLGHHREQVFKLIKTFIESNCMNSHPSSSNSPEERR